MTIDSSRPDGISVLAIVTIASAVVGAFLLLATGSRQDAIVDLVGGLIVLASLALGYGFWTLQDWAWLLGLVLYAFAFLEALALLLNGTLNTNLVVGPLVVLYLIRPDVKAAFGRETSA